MNTAVAFLIYRRPGPTQRVFDAIARAKPPVLLIVADGPRDGGEQVACDQTRRIVEKVDWPCDVRRNYADRNMGCKRRVSSGIDWVFSQVEEAIILEDDCLPHPDFFPYCEELLNRYRTDARVGHIGGTDPRQGPVPGVGSYYFSRYPSIWGWATWRRAWNLYDVELSKWPAQRDQRRHRELFGSVEEGRHFEYVWNEIHEGRLDTWDGQWLFALRTNGCLAIAPNGNLVTNIGFNSEATHTRDRRHPFAEMPASGLRFPLENPEDVICDTKADLQRARREFLKRASPGQRIQHTLGNRYFYGRILRSLPLLGPLWARWRERDGRHGRGPL